ncbi:hypothetical protein DSC91_000031 [Paraburkholderia caffeinilytica]|uniref:hypothetical protein n=1 Tax=Paraburkholderia caffeinilytica TaxID=1761016 RepID=UPI000E215927|nr:hypothetical protein [Paraburkholderia caffeinilytica]AXL48594.1 hypothetical protein DSC91_000031 [Paraburkholderia caffeinilytica]CAB3797852.1 hypothetical protein LMG28690_04608 [Paraburkholderia caffeinilytica]
MTINRLSRFFPATRSSADTAAPPTAGVNPRPVARSLTAPGALLLPQRPANAAAAGGKTSMPPRAANPQPRAAGEPGRHNIDWLTRRHLLVDSGVSRTDSIGNPE